MLKNRIVYLAVLVLLLLFRIAYTGYAAGMLLVMALVLPVFSWLVSLPGAIGTSVRVSAPDDIQRGAEAHVTLTLRQSPLFLTGPVKGTLRVSDLAGGKVSTSRVNNRSTGFEIDTAHCSTFRCSVKHVRVYDLLGIFPLPAKKVKDFTLSVLPIPAEPPEHPDWTAGKTLVAKPFSGAAHPYDLREYRTGDTLRSIHWKKSAALDKTVVRDTLAPVELIADIWLDWPEPGSGRDYVLDQLAWCIIYLKQNNAGASIHWLDAAGAEQRLYCDLGQLDNIIPEMLTRPAGRRCPTAMISANEILLSAGLEGGAAG